MSGITFEKWSGPEGIEQFIINQTGCKPYSGAGKRDFNSCNWIIKSVSNIALNSTLQSFPMAVAIL